MSDYKLVSGESLDALINEKLSGLKDCKDITKSYIYSILKKYTNQLFQFDEKLIGIEYLSAASKSDFCKFQEIGDWIFFIQSNYPKFFEKNSSHFYISIGQSSYYRCYKLLNKWQLFEELADNFVNYSNSIYKIDLTKIKLD